MKYKTKNTVNSVYGVFYIVVWLGIKEWFCTHP